MPLGSFHATANGKSYIVTHSHVAGGRGEKLIAEARDGSDYISANLYHLQAGSTVKPCEMPLAKVLAFIADLTVDAT